MAQKAAAKKVPAAKKVAKVAAKKVAAKKVAKVAAKQAAAKKVAKVAAKKVAKVAAKQEPAKKVAKVAAKQEPVKKVAKAAAPAFALYGELSEKQMRALGQQLDKLQDPNGFKHYQLLAKHTKGPNGPLLWHLLRCGLVGREVQSAGLYTRFAEYIPDDVTAADVIAVLRHVPADMGTLDRGKAREHMMLTPGALVAIDELLVHAYVDDPAAVRAAAAELPHALQVAIACVRRRAGEEIDPGHAREIFEFLAEKHCAHGIGFNIDVPRIVAGERVEARLADDGKVGELAALFGTREAWAGLQLAWARSHVAEFRGEPDYTAQRTRAGLATASLRDLIYLFGTGFWKHSSLLAVLDARAEAPAELLATAAELLRGGLAAFRIDAAQIKPAPEPRRAAGGDDDGYGDGDDDDDDSYDGGGDDDAYDGGGGGERDGEVEEEPEPEPGPDDDKVRALAEALTVLASERLHAQGLAVPGEVDAAFDLERVYDSDPAYIVRLRGVLTLLGPARAHAVILRVLEKPYYYGKAAAIADVCHDEAVVEAVLARLDRADAHVDAELLGYNGPQVVPALARHAAAADAAKRGKYHEAINYVLARASATKVAWDVALDEHIDIGAIQFSYGGSKVDPVLALLDGLPLARYEAVMRGNLRRGAEAVAVARCLRSDAPDGLLEEVFAALLGQSAKISSGALGGRLRALGGRVVGPLRRAFGDTPTQATLMRELERALDDDAFAAFKATLDRPIETREQELRRLCAGLPGPKRTIYRLKRAERAPAADEVGRIGGAPRGVAAGEVPRYGDEAMEHVITLDLAGMPGLGRKGQRSLSLYLPDPQQGEHHAEGELVWRTEAELAAAPGSVADAAAIEVEAFEVPSAIFGEGCEGELLQVRRIVYSSQGYALGEPLWLQGEDEGFDPDFLFQFDEGLCHINLGDSGVMYVFGSSIVWQCH